MADVTQLLSMPAELTADSGAGSTNTTATATIAAPGAGKSIYVLGISLSADTAPAAAVTATLIDGAATNRGRWKFSASAFIPFEVPFGRPRKIAENTSLTLTFPALGVGVTGVAQIHYSIRAA